MEFVSPSSRMLCNPICVLTGLGCCLQGSERVLPTLDVVIRCCLFSLRQVVQLCSGAGWDKCLEDKQHPLVAGRGSNSLCLTSLFIIADLRERVGFNTREH